MREDNPLSETRVVKASKFSDQNQIPKPHHQNSKGNSNSSKFRSASSWGSQIVKGLAGDKKTKLQATTATVTVKKQPLMGSDMANQKNPFVPSHSRVKRSLIGDLSCSANASQVHPQSLQTHHQRQSSRDLFMELDQMRSLLQESKEREFKLQAELAEYKRSPRVLDLERELEMKKSEIVGLLRKVELLEEEKSSISEQKSEEIMPKRDEEEHEVISMAPSSKSSLEMEVVELRRLNKELQLQKRNLACRLSSVEAQLASLPKASEVCSSNFQIHLIRLIC